MAPPNGSSNSRRLGVSKQPVSKPVVPALPLPYVKRQAAAAAVASHVTFSRSPPSDPAAEKQDTNGAVQEMAKDTTHLAPVPGSRRAAELEAGDANQPVSHPTTADAEPNGHGSSAVPAAGRPDPAGEPPVERAYETTAKVQAAEDPISRPIPQALETSAPLNGIAAKSEPRQKLVEVEYYPERVVKSRPPPPVSPTRYQMPLPFQPNNGSLGVIVNGDMPSGPRPKDGPHPIHQAHPSNGSTHLGTFHDSQNSSPAPPHSGGIAPPPGMAGPDGRPAYMGHAGNGFPPMMPYGADVMQVPGFDNYGRPAMGYGPMDSYPPYGTNFGPSTPHSFHDSQSSAHPEDGGMYVQYPPGASRNGRAVHCDDIHAQNPRGRLFAPPEYPRMMPNLGPPPMMPYGDHGDGLIGYLQQQFASPELADCTLELRYSDDRARPMRIPGHRLILSRSPELYSLLRQQALQANAPDGAVQTVLVESDSKWVRSDTFYMAVQRLYGLPLLQMPPRNRAEAGDVTEAGSVSEQFEFSLSYAAAGRLLDWVSVVRRGCEVATQLLSWQTMERGLEFALDDYRDRGTYESYKYGDGSRAVLNAVVAYIVHNMPPSFNLDTSAEEPAHYARLPTHPPRPGPTPTGAVSKTNSPAIASGSCVQLGKGRRLHPIANIQFGDLSLEEGRGGVESETPKAARQAQPVSHAILSRVLLNLPFTQLKTILESPGSGNVNGWANTETRYRLVKRVVEEREARRLRALDAAVGGRVPDSEAIKAALGNPDPRDVGRWSALGWQEEMLPYGKPDGPSLGRKWVPLMVPQNGCAAEYP